MDLLIKYKYLTIPFLVWLGIQLFKVFYDYYETKQLHLSRLFGAGGMPSAYSAVVCCLAAMIGKSVGMDTAEFAIITIVALIIMYDAVGIRRSIGEQAKILNEILKNNNKNNIQKLQEMTGHTPVQVLAGAIIGIVVGLIF